MIWGNAPAGGCRGRRDPGESGSGTLLIVAVVMVSGVLALAGVVGAGYVSAVHRARAVADAAAISGAAEVGRGADACRGAAMVARKNRAQITSCSMAGDALDFVVSVTAEVSVRTTFPGLPDHVRATAHAGRLTTPG